MSNLLTPKELAERWKVQVGTLRKWRYLDTGPAYIKMGDGRNSQVRYRLNDVIDYEKNRLFTPE
jgi:hypothetical protein